MINLRKIILNRILRKEDKNIQAFIVKVNSFAAKIETFTESMLNCNCPYSATLSTLHNLASNLHIREAKDFLIAWHEFSEIEEGLMWLKSRKEGIDIKKIKTLLEETETLALTVKSAIRKIHIFDWVESIIIAFVLAMIIRSFVVQAFKIPSGSMTPTLLKGDIILVNKFIYGAKIPFTDLRLPKIREPKRGDVVVFIYPEDPKKDFIKRLVAFSGETVEIKNGTIYINGKPLLDPVFSQRFYYNRGRLSEEGERITVPADSFFVLGDNSASSQDSRYWGFLPHKNILGKALLIYWPPQRIRIIK